jgi:sulfur-oxidizing protein SoxX
MRMPGSRQLRRKSSANLRLLSTVVAWLATLPLAAVEAEKGGLQPIAIMSDAVPASLTGTPGDPTRGRSIVKNRQLGLCLLCHSGPFPEEQFQGNLAPDLVGAGSRWSAGQLRLRLMDATLSNPATIMPPYYRIEGLNRVGAAWNGLPALTAQQIEDVVAFLTTLRE